MSKLRVTADVQLPKLPNYLLFENEAAGKIDVADITDESLKEIGEAWTTALIAHAQARRAANKERA